MSLGHLTEPLRKPACKIFHLSTLTFFISATEIGNSYTPLGAHTLIRTLQGSGNLDSERRSFDCLFGLEERRWPSWWRRARAAAAGAARTFPSRGAPPPGRAAGRGDEIFLGAAFCHFLLAHGKDVGQRSCNTVTLGPNSNATGQQQPSFDGFVCQRISQAALASSSRLSHDTAIASTTCGEMSCAAMRQPLTRVILASRGASFARS